MAAPERKHTKGNGARRPRPGRAWREDLRAWWLRVLRPSALDDAADSWVLPHLFLPFLLYYFLRIWWVALLLDVGWEFFERASHWLLGRYPFLHTQKTDAPETWVNSWIMDPGCGATGIALSVLVVWLFDLPPLRAGGTDGITVLQMILLLVAGSHAGSPVGFYFFALMGGVLWGVFFAWNGAHAAGTYVVGALSQLYFQLWFVHAPIRVGHYVGYLFNGAAAAAVYLTATSFFATFGQPAY